MRKQPPIHLAVQNHIISLLPPGEAVMEHSLPNHFADVAWLEKKIVFEIQTSQIAVEKAANRINDYTKMGYTVVWILHDKLFNKKWLSTTEQFLRGEIAYFTNISATGHGIIYDQFEILKMRKRVLRSNPLSIDLSKPIRSKKGTLNFRGDRNDQNRSVRREFEREAAKLEIPLIRKLFQAYDNQFIKILKKLSH